MIEARSWFNSIPDVPTWDGKEKKVEKEDATTDDDKDDLDYDKIFCQLMQDVIGVNKIGDAITTALSGQKNITTDS